MKENDAMESYTDYMFLLKPSEEVKRAISGCKLGVGQMIGSYTGMQGKAHISVFRKDRCKPYLVRPYIDQLKHKLASMPPITIEVEGFDFYVHGADKMTIYARVKPNYKMDKWFELLKHLLEFKKGYSLTPHITVSKTIPVDAFYRVWPVFRYLNYKDTFTVDCLTVLERETLNNESKWEIYDEIPFCNELRG